MVMKNLTIEVLIEKEISCYQNENLPLHKECPYNKIEIDTNCNLCIRRKEKIISFKTLEESQK